MGTLYYVIVGATSAFIGLSIEKALSRRMNGALRFIIALALTVLIVAGVSVILKVFAA